MKARFQTPLKLESSEKSLSMSFSVSASEIRFKNAPIKITQDRIMNTLTGITLVLKSEDIIIGQIIGQGSCGVVLAALHVPTQTPLAIKCFDVYKKEKINQLKNDLTILDRCQSPYLVQFYGAWFMDGQVKVALELMDLGSAAKVPTPVPEQYLKNIAYQILCGLDSLHSQHELHRDIKPGNVLLNSKGEVKLADFGISKDLQSTLGLCKTFVGTPRVLKEWMEKSMDFQVIFGLLEYCFQNWLMEYIHIQKLEDNLKWYEIQSHCQSLEHLMNLLLNFKILQYAAYKKTLSQEHQLSVY